MKPHSDHHNMDNKRKLIHFLSFALVNIFLINTCVQSLVSEINLRSSKISQHQTAKKADTPVVKEDKENKEREEIVNIGDLSLFLQSYLIADHHFFKLSDYHPVLCLVKSPSPLFLKNRTMRI